MSNPQKANGYTAIANEILEALIAARLSGQELACVLFVIRKTYGFNKKIDAISFSQFANGLRIKRGRVSQVIRGLISKKILTVSEKRHGYALTYSLNKIYAKWNLENKKGLYRFSACDCIVFPLVTVSKKRLPNNTKDNSTKDNSTKDINTLPIFKKSAQKEVKKSKKNIVIPTDEDIQNAKTSQAKLALWFAKKYFDNTGMPYDLKTKDYVICQKLLDKYSKEMIFAKIGILEIYCSGKVEAWFANGGWGDFTIGKLSSAWNNLLPRLTKEQKKEVKDQQILSKYEQHERRINELLSKKV